MHIYIHRSSCHIYCHSLDVGQRRCKPGFYLLLPLVIWKRSFIPSTIENRDVSDDTPSVLTTFRRPIEYAADHFNSAFWLSVCEKLSANEAICENPLMGVQLIFDLILGLQYWNCDVQPSTLTGSSRKYNKRLVSPTPVFSILFVGRCAAYQSSLIGSVKMMSFAERNTRIISAAGTSKSGTGRNMLPLLGEPSGFQPAHMELVT